MVLYVRTFSSIVKSSCRLGSQNSVLKKNVKDWSDIQWRTKDSCEMMAKYVTFL